MRPTKVELVDGARDRFMADARIRALSCADWLLEHPGDPADGIDMSRDTATRALIERAFDHARETISTDVTLSGPDGEHEVDWIDFHRRFGWIVEGSSIKAHLGKITLQEHTSLSVGSRSYFSGPAIVRGGDRLSLGAFTSIAEGFFVNTSRDFHPTNHASTFNFTENRRLAEDGLSIPIAYGEFETVTNGVAIGSDVWIGRDVRVYHGAQIGHGCVVAERSLVRGTLEPFGIYGGQPARLIRFRFPESVREQLLNIAWWCWPMSRLRRNRNFFSTDLTQYRGTLLNLIVD